MVSASSPHPLIAIKELKIGVENDGRFQIHSLDPEAEAKTLATIRQLDHPHLIKAIATYRRGSQCYFIFPWADNGNLRDLWERNGSGDQIKYIQWVLEQLEGLSEALSELHAKQCRHGDLKPENILCFKDAKSPLGILVIADVGLAKVHMNPTQVRQGGTRTMTGTWMYGPPEEKGSPRSRRYDTWSMGCIILEFIIWLLYGYDELERFRSSIERFYTREEGSETNNTPSARVHPEVERWIQHVYLDPRCGDKPKATAIRSLLEFVHERLLVVKTTLDRVEIDLATLPVQHDIPEVRVSAPTEDLAHDDRSPVSTPLDDHFRIEEDPLSGCRAHADELYNTIHDICERSIRQVPPVLPLFNPEHIYRRYAGPRAKLGDSLTVPGQAPTPPTGRPSLIASSQSPQVLQVNVGDFAAREVNFIPWLRPENVC